MSLSAADPRPMDAPELSVEAELWRSLTTGVAVVLGKKKGIKLLRAMAEDMAERLSHARAVTPIRGDQERYARETEAKAAAVATFRRELSGILAALDGE